MFVGIVAGRDDDAGICLLLPGKICHSGSRDRAHRLDVAAHGAKSCHQRGFQHIGGDAGILADDHSGAAPLLLHQNDADGLPHAKCHVGSQILTDDTADAVGPK